MAASQPFAFSCTGGLNTNASTIEISQNPGLATRLVNFEVEPEGGYRRIDGFTRLETRPNGETPILGIKTYADGGFVCSGTDIHFTNDGSTWLQVNRSGVASSGDNYAAFTGRSALTRTSQVQTSFAFYHGGVEHGKVIVFDGVNKPYLFHMTGTGDLDTRTYYSEEITIGSDETPKVGVIHKNRLVVAGSPANPNTLYFSADTDPTDFSGFGSKAINLEDQVVEVRSFRGDIIIFCRNTIHKVVNAEDNATIAVVPITKNIGCLDSQSVQEIGGDLVFLAPDGIRTLAATERIGDVELSSVSGPVQPIIRNIAENISDYTITSTVLRHKNQYRLFYSKSTETRAESKGVIGTITKNGFQWSETLGIKALAMSAEYDNNVEEVKYHGDHLGWVYIHDYPLPRFMEGEDGKPIHSEYQSAYLDFGDAATRKTLSFAKVTIEREGIIDADITVQYDFEDENVPQPLKESLIVGNGPAIFGESLFTSSSSDSVRFGAASKTVTRKALQGSGYNASFRIETNDSSTRAYRIDGLYIDYYPSGRR